MSLAKAAVSGDEAALDLFADYHKIKPGHLEKQRKEKEGLSFYFGTSDGMIACYAI